MSTRAFSRPYLGDKLDADLWARTNAAAVNRLREIARGTIRRHGRMRWALIVAATVLAFFWLQPIVRPAHPGPGAAFLGVVLAACCGVVIGWIVTGLYGAFKGRAYEDLLYNLTPLGDRSELCHQALEMLSVPAVRAYRDRVVGSGRELLIADYTCMSAIQRREQCNELREQTRRTCQRLHGVFDTPAASS